MYGRKELRMAKKSAWAKDFGMYVLKNTRDKSKLPEMYWPQFAFYNLAVLEPGSYTTTANTVAGGEEYAMTVDFDDAIFEKLLDTMPKANADKLRDLVDRIVDYPAMVRFDGGITVGLKARLGTLQHGSGEDFIPFVALDVIKI
jgi:hypothetical protein